MTKGALTLPPVSLGSRCCDVTCSSTGRMGITAIAAANLTTLASRSV